MILKIIYRIPVIRFREDERPVQNIQCDHGLLSSLKFSQFRQALLESKSYNCDSDFSACG